MEADEGRCIRLLFPKSSLTFSLSSSPGVRWLIGSPLFLPVLTVVASLRCLHALPDDPFSPDFSKEAEDIKTLLLKGFDIVGALFVGNQNCEQDAYKAVEASRTLRKYLFGDKASHCMIGCLSNNVTGDTRFFVSDSSKPSAAEVSNVIYEDIPENYLWKNGCLLRCELALRLPVYFPKDKSSDIHAVFSSLVDSAASKLRDPYVAYLLEGPGTNSEEPLCSVLHGADLDFCTEELKSKTPVCSYFFPRKHSNLSSTFRESAAAIRVTVLFNQSRSRPDHGVPIVEYFPASEPAQLLVICLKLDVLCYTLYDFPVSAAISHLIIPALVDQLNTMKKAAAPELLTNHAQLCPYHFFPPGFLIPITAIYDIRYGEIEEKQGELRRSLHLRLGLPLDRPLLRIANSLTFDIKGNRGSNLTRDGTTLLRDVHTEVPSRGVAGGITSLIDGSYEYYHYLLDGFDDNGWGCAYRSLQTIISWYRLQQYTSISVPSHREIQQALVEIGDKDPSFIGSREWIGAIELSFVLDKLLGVSCKIINVRSGEELPEKCRELAMHFELQGTPVMIGGGVLAYTLLGVDYNESSGDSAFLILDPHYTGADDLKKVVNGGWCGWKKAIDSKGRSFFLKDKFYNLLLPQRPNMV